MRPGISTYIVLLIFCCSYSISQAQDYKAKGDKAWQQGEIKTAVNAYGFIKDLDKDATYLMKRGIGNFKLNALKKSIRDFTQARKVGNQDPELFNYMAQVKQHLQEHEEAAFFYKEYIKAIGEKNPKATRAYIELKNCLYAADHINDESTAMINDFGEDVNSYYDEIYPLQSPRFGNTFYYTSNSNKSDMRGYSVALDKNGEWLAKKKFSIGINSKHDDYMMDISPDGQSMLYIRSEDGLAKNKIYVSTFDENEEQHIIELPDYLIFGAVDLQIVNRNTIAFASKDLGGMGGYDLFTINYKNRVWSDPINLGTEVNTEFDERSPYLSVNGEYVYFSSDKPYCFGGHDIYYYNFNWLDKGPRNLGQPINSPGNDLQYRISEDGQLAILSSDRKTGEGGYDVYMMYLKDPQPFPPKDMTQLEYVADYLRKPKSHLDKLKEKLKDEKPEKELAETDVTQVSEPVEEVLTVEEAEPKAQQKEEPKTKEEPKADIAITEKEEPKEKLVKKETVEEKEATKEIASVDRNKNSKDNSNKKTSTKKVLPQDPPKKEITAIEEVDTSTTGLKVKNERDLRYTLLYEDRQDLQNDVNKSKLEKLVRLLEEKPEYKVHLVAYTDYREPGLPEFMQYNTLKRANLVADILLQYGIDEKRIAIESMCDNYPLARKEVAGNKNEEFLPLNKRIDLEVRDDSYAVLMSQGVSDFKIPGYAMDRKYELFTHIREEVYYSVEIASSEIIFKNAVLRLYNDIYIRRETATAPNNYYVGIYNSLADAQALETELKDSSAPYAKVVAFYNGKAIKKSEIDQFLTDYPELKDYSLN